MHNLEGTALDTWRKACVEAGKVAGRESTNDVHYSRWLEDVGFADVNEKRFELATSPWRKGRKQKELGIRRQGDIHEALGGTLPFICRNLRWEPAEGERLLVDVRKDKESGCACLYAHVSLSATPAKLEVEFPTY